MSERYVKLFSLSENLYSAGAPVVVAAGALLKDNQSGRMLAQLKLRNISPQIIKAATVSVIPFDTVGNPLGDAIRHQYLDLNVARDVNFGQKVVIALPKTATRSFTVIVEEVVFATNTLWKDTGEPWKSLPTPTLLSAALADKELEKQYRIQYGNTAKCVPNGVKDVWYCTCGALNRNTEKICHRCNVSLTDLLAFDMETLKKECAIRLEAERKQKAAADKKAKKNTRIAIIAIIAVVICIAAGVFISARQKESASLAQYQSAVELLEAGRLNEAYEAFLALDGYKDSREKASSIFDMRNEKYDHATALMEAGQLMEAYEEFVSLDGYIDSNKKAEDIIVMCDEIYDAAFALLEMGHLTEAYNNFVFLNGYKDSAEQAESVNNMFAENYSKAVALMDTGKMLEAYKVFNSIASYKDSAANAEFAYAKHMANILQVVEVGGYISFGACEQDNNLSNGYEDIEWLVLAKEDNRVLVISRYGLYPHSYNNKRTNVTWESCTLRQWLNNDFLNAFSAAEQALIPTATVVAQAREGKDTQDRVFILNITEAEQYLGESYGLNCQATEYAIANGARVSDSNGCCNWWLRTPGKEEKDLAVYVTDTGGIMRIGGMVHITEFTVRPALWITIP